MLLFHIVTGKTTLADSLVASNGIISQRMAGKVRAITFELIDWLITIKKKENYMLCIKSSYNFSFFFFLHHSSLKSTITTIRWDILIRDGMNRNVASQWSHQPSDFISHWRLTMFVGKKSSSSTSSTHLVMSTSRLKLPQLFDFVMLPSSL